MAAHTIEQRAFIVRKLAAFGTPKDICAAFAAIYRDTACSENDVLANDPRVTVLPPDLHSLFYAERERILTDPHAAPFAEQRARLIVLSRQADDYQSRQDYANARAVFRQIAEELGVIGNKGNSKAVPAATPEDDAPVVAITRTIVDPVAPESV